MRRDIIKDVEIKEPPIEELTRKYSAFSTIKRTCLGGCGCLVFLLIILAVVLKFFIGTGPQEIKTTPDNFPSEIPIYDQENIETITFISGKYKNRVVEIAAIFPKIILSPLLIALEKDSNETTSKTYTLKNFWEIINTPVSDQKDIIKIRWSGLKAEPEFVYSYYKTELEKQNYKIEIESQGNNTKQFSFDDGAVNGSFYLQMINTSLINHAILTVNY